MPGRVALALVDETNHFQQLLKEDAEAAAARAGLELETVFTGEGLAEHLGALRRLIVDPERRPLALLVMAVRDRGLDKVVREAAAAGVHFVLLNAVEDDLDAIRREVRAASVSTVCPDEVETGRVQGRQMRALVAPGRRVLYIQGSPRSLASRQRTEGVREATAGAPFEVALAGGDWSPAFAGRTVREWLRFAVGGRRPFDLVVCQNDHMAGGVLEALAAAAAESGQPDVARVPVAGCDGAPEIGQKMVRGGRLAATVVLPRVAGPAVDEVASLVARGEKPPTLVTLAASSFPPLAELRPIP
jgi:ribose transport system substrate-binding protein